MDVVLEFLLLFRRVVRFVAVICFFGGLIAVLAAQFLGLLFMVLGAAGIAFYDRLIFYVAEKAGREVYLGK